MQPGAECIQYEGIRLKPEIMIPVLNCARVISPRRASAHYCVKNLTGFYTLLVKSSCVERSRGLQWRAYDKNLHVVSPLSSTVSCNLRP